MGVADWLWAASSISPATRVIGWITTGAVWPLFTLALALKPVDFALQKLFRAAVHGEFVHGHPFGARTSQTLHSILPGPRLAAVLPGFEPREGRGYKPAEESVVVFGQQLLVTTVDTLAEEGLFRGIPLAVALWVGGFKIVLVALGTALWAVLHGTGRGIAILLTSGWLLAGLWLAGHWELAVGLHLGTNLLLYTAHAIFRQIFA